MLNTVKSRFIDHGQTFDIGWRMSGLGFAFFFVLINYTMEIVGLKLKLHEDVTSWMSYAAHGC